MSIKYINPITTPYSRIGDIAFFDRKAMEEQNKYDKALALIAQQKKEDANTISYDDEARKQYLKEVQDIYNSVIENNYGDLAKGYNDVLNAITKDASHPYHNLNKIQANNIAQYKQAQQKYGADLITVKSPYETPLYDSKTKQWVDPSSLQYEALKASDYALNTERFIGNDLRGSLQQLGISPNSKIKYLLDYGSVDQLTEDQIKQLAQSPEAIQLFKSLNPTYNIDNRAAVGYNPKTGQNIFSTDEGISNYIYSVLKDKAYRRVNVQHMWNRTAMAEDERKREESSTPSSSDKINYSSDQIIFSDNKPDEFLKDPTVTSTAHFINPMAPSGLVTSKASEEENEDYNNKLNSIKEFLGGEELTNSIKQQVYREYKDKLKKDENGDPIVDAKSQQEIDNEINKRVKSTIQGTYNKFYQQRLSYMNMKGELNNDYYSMFNSERMLEPNYLINHDSYIDGVKVNKEEDVYEAFDNTSTNDVKEYRAYKTDNKNLSTFTAYSPKFKKYAVMTIANGHRFETIFPPSIQNKLEASSEINDKLINTDYYAIGKPTVPLNKQYGWTNGASLILEPNSGRSYLIYAPQNPDKDPEKQKQLIKDLNNTTNIIDAWEIVNDGLKSGDLIIKDPSYIIQSNVNKVVNEYKTGINQKKN